MCRHCEKPYTEEAGPNYASAVPGLCVSCYAQMTDAEHWVQCWPAFEDEDPFAVVRLTDGRRFGLNLHPEDELKLLAAAEVAQIERHPADMAGVL